MDIQSVSVAIAAASVVAGVIYYSFQLRHQTRIRQTDLVVRLNPWFDLNAIELQQMFLKVFTLEYKDYDDFVKKYGPPTIETPVNMALLALGNYFEGVGTLLYRKLVEIDIVWDACGVNVPVLWPKMKPFIEGLRKQLKEPQIYTYFEYLYNELQRREQQIAKIQ